MSLYILINEEYYSQNPLFESSLNKTGYNNAKKLCNFIDILNIDIIYSSPFYRTVQTIYPYCIEYNKLINIDNSLYESMNSLLFNKYNKNFCWCNLPNKYHHIINKKYKSIYHYVNLHESFDDVCKRVKPFINKIKNYKKNILIITHPITCNAIRNYFNNHINENNKLNNGEIIKIF